MQFQMHLCNITPKLFFYSFPMTILPNLYQKYATHMYKYVPDIQCIPRYINYQAAARPSSGPAPRRRSRAGPWRLGAGPGGAAPPPLGILYILYILDILHTRLVHLCYNFGICFEFVFVCSWYLLYIEYICLHNVGKNVQLKVCKRIQMCNLPNTKCQAAAKPPGASRRGGAEARVLPCQLAAGMLRSPPPQAYTLLYKC